MSKIALSAPVAGVGTATIKGPETSADIEFQLPPRAGQVMVAGPAFRAWRNANVTVSSDTPTGIVCNVESFDTANVYDTATGRFTPNVAGWYLLTARMTGEASTAMTYGLVQILKNGVLVAEMAAPAYAARYARVLTTELVYLNGTTDYVSMQVMLTGTGTLVTYGTEHFTNFGGHLVRPA